LFNRATKYAYLAVLVNRKSKCGRCKVRLSGDVDGWYARLGGMTRGSGFAIGPGYRFHSGDVLVDLSGAYSLKAYKAVDANVRWLRAYDDRLELWTSFEDFPQEDFFGMGSTAYARRGQATTSTARRSM